MSDPAEEFAHLKAMHESAVLLKEGGKPVALLPAFGFTAAGRGETMDLLLVPFEHSGYTTPAVLRAQARWLRQQLEGASRRGPELVGAVVEQRPRKHAVARNAGRTSEGGRMKVRFKITTALLTAIRSDLRRPHPFAHERVGFISAGLSASGDDLLVLAHAYRPRGRRRVPARPNSGRNDGSRRPFATLCSVALQGGVAMFHVHTHGGNGIPGFSGIDLRENAKFVPDFFKVAPQCAHGAIVLSDTAAHGLIWFGRAQPNEFITSFVEVGVPLCKWSTA